MKDRLLLIHNRIEFLVFRDQYNSILTLIFVDNDSSKFSKLLCIWISNLLCVAGSK